MKKYIIYFLSSVILITFWFELPYLNQLYNNIRTVDSLNYIQRWNIPSRDSNYIDWNKFKEQLKWNIKKEDISSYEYLKHINGSSLNWIELANENGYINLSTFFESWAIEVNEKYILQGNEMKNIPWGIVYMGNGFLNREGTIYVYKISGSSPYQLAIDIEIAKLNTEEFLTWKPRNKEFSEWIKSYK